MLPSSSSSLPLKEHSLFKRAMKCYENKQHKNGLKFINQILSNPRLTEHGETLALKGLFCYFLGRKEEAYDLVKRGLKVGLKSYMCWHSYGVIHRADKNYEEAIKCFRNALKWDSNNTLILQDLSSLQIQIRDLEGYLDTRARIFKLSPTQRSGWIGFAVANHLNKEYGTCLSVLDAFRQTISASCSNYSQGEYSELLIYENMVIEESGDIKSALEHLTAHQANIRDKLTILENYSRFYLKLKKYKEAESYIKQLIVRNPERVLYYEWLFEALEVETNGEKAKILSEIFRKMPKSRLPKRLCLDLVYGHHFKKLIDIYLQSDLNKGVPSVFVEIKALYKNKEHVKVIQQTVLDYKECLTKHNSLVEGGLQEPPTTLIWVYYFLSQHYCHLNNFDEALSYIDLAILHTPTFADLYVAKGKIFKKTGNYELAAESLMEAKNLEPADKFINSKCAYYLFRANRITIAEDVISSFSIENPNVGENLFEMQCIWYLLESALAYERLEMYGEALKRCHEIDKHFVQFYQDQFDFHNYSLKGTSLRPYIYLLRFEENIKGHFFYKRAAHCAIRIYIKLYDTPKTELTPETSKQEESLTLSEQKKMMSKQRKAKKKAQLEKVGDEKQETKSKTATVKGGSVIVKDELSADDYKNIPSPLDEAIKFHAPLKLMSVDDICTHLYAFEIYYRKGKLLIMLQSIKRAYSIQPNHPQLHGIIIKYLLLVNEKKRNGALGFPIRDVIDKQMEPIWKGRTAIQINEDFINENNNSLKALLYAARSLYQIDSTRQSEAIDLCIRIDELDEISVEECTEVLQFMKDGFLGDCKPQIAEYINRAHMKFPFATAFMPFDLAELNLGKIAL